MALGLLLASGGVAVLAAAAPATAKKTPVKVCHATSSDTHPYNFIVVDDDSTQYEAHLAHRNHPNKTWKSAGTWNGKAHEAGDPKPDLIDGLDGDIDKDSCYGYGEPERTLAEGAVSFTDPTCEDPDGADVEVTEAENASYEIDGKPGPGATVTVTFTAEEGAEFEDGTTKQVEAHTFPSLDDCEQVEPPAIVPPTFTEGDCDTDPQVHLPEAPYTYVVVGEVAPGSTVTVHAKDDRTDEVVRSWEHTFDEVSGCDTVLPPVVNPPVVNPPKVNPPKANPPKVNPPAVSPPAAAPPQVSPPAVQAPPRRSTVIPSSVHAGSSGLGLIADSRGQSGLALVATGALMLLAGLGLGLTRRDGEA